MKNPKQLLSNPYLWAFFGFIFVWFFSIYIMLSTGSPVYYNPISVLNFSNYLISISMASYFVSLSTPIYFGPTVISGIYLIQLLVFRKNVGRFQIYAVGIFGLLSILSILFSWNDGVKYQGLAYVITVLVFNMIAYTILATIAWHAKKNQNQPLLFLNNLLLYAILVWISFPWLGELL